VIAVPPIVATSRPDARPHDHLVSFYDTADYLARTVARFLAPALDQGGTAIVLGTYDHRDRFASALRAEGHDPDQLGARYVALDAATTLAAIRRDGRIVPELFREVVGNLVRGATAGDGPVHVYGEMVALLWEEDGVVEVLRCEELWNELLATTPIALLCAYPTGAFGDEPTTEAFAEVCGTHSAVLPTESFAGLGDEDAARRTALLEQQVVADRNERARLHGRQAELQAAVDRLTAVDRERQQFTAMVVHDLQNPTVVLTTVLEMLRDHRGTLDEEQIDRYLDFAARSTRQIQRLVDDILIMGRLESGTFTYELEDLDLRPIVEEVALEVRGRTGRRIDVVADDELPLARADAGRQQQILTNLVSNATKFSEAPSPVTIELTRSATRVVVRVVDRGYGIDTADLPQLFRPFSRVGEVGDHKDGTGLGLFIAKALVEGQGGTIEVRSERGQGTAFTYTVPLAKEPDLPGPT
jgi:signal transduction histidine kinase